MRITYAHVWLGLALCLGLTLMGAYTAAFAPCVESACAGFILPYNIPDHFHYLNTIDQLADSGVYAALRANHGVALIYHFLSGLLFEDPREGVFWLSFLVNALLYVLSVACFSSLCGRLGISRLAALPLVFFPPFLIFSGLINKDMILLFLLQYSVIALYDRRFVLLLVLAVLIGMTRIQYVAFPVLALFLMGGKLPRRMILGYAVMALGAALIAKWTAIFDVETTGLGVSDFIYHLNKEYMIGSLLFNPVRVLQYWLALGQGWLRVTTAEGINLMALAEGLAFLWFAWLLPGLYRTFVSRPLRDRGWRLVTAVVLSYLLILLLTPITEPRYLMPLYPLALLAACHSRARRTRLARVAPEMRPESSGPAPAAPQT